MAFAPKFIDLVRNSTTTVGTADFVLGPAVNGYASFAAACQVGDCFYYSAIGVDKPAEREVGRGILLAGGQIGRDPIGGVKTNFTGGTKSIALIAAAEWFNAVQGAPLTAASRGALSSAAHRQPTILGEPGREGLFVWDGSNLSQKVVADAAQAVTIAPASDPSGASGAWIRSFSGAVDARWFGAKGNGTTDDSVALQAWLDHGGLLFLPPLLFRSSRKLICRKQVVVEGAAHGFDSRLPAYRNMPGSRVLFDAGVGGMELQPSTTLTDPAAVAAAGSGAFTQEGAFNSEIRDIALIGQGGAPATGFLARTYFHARNVQVCTFSGKGFDLSASTVADGVGEFGNLSNSSMKDCGAWQCGSHGLHIRGRDANTCAIDNFNAIQCGGWGIWNQSLIGNVFHKPSLSSNALGAIKADGSQANLFIFPYIETGVGSHCEVGLDNVVIGDISALNDGNTPTQLGFTSRFNRVQLQNTYAPAALPTEDAWIYKWDGLYLQGRGSTRDVTLINRAGNVAATVPANSTHWQVFGTSFAHMFQTLGVNQAWPGVASGYVALLANASNGAMLGGSGTSGDVSLVSSAGAVALRVAHGSTNVEIEGCLRVPEMTAASAPTPAAGYQNLFIDSSDHKLKRKDSSGAVTAIN